MCCTPAASVLVSSLPGVHGNRALVEEENQDPPGLDWSPLANRNTGGSQFMMV